MILQTNKKERAGFLNSALFVIFLCFIVLRLSFAENPHIESFTMQGIFYDNFISICISSILIILFIVWFIAGLWTENFTYRLSFFGYGILIFIAACVISTIFASNRRAAITDSITILSAMLTAAALSNLLQTTGKKKILLFALIAIAVANVYQCTEQFFSSNKFLIEQYKAEPVEQLERLGIEPGSFEQMLYENRLYSKDVRGFFTTSNSVAGFLVLAVFCVFAAFNFKPNSSDIRKSMNKLSLPIILLLVLFAGLIFTHSKGAIVSFAVSGLILLSAIKIGQISNRSKILIIFAGLFLIIICIFFVIGYGTKYGTLPGGNSMLVRWQYWTAAAKIAANHLITGIGGGNFGSYYPHYKIPQALETVRDPHCFVLNILSQYGLIGLAGFCIAIFSPIIKNFMQNKTGDNLTGKDNSATIAKTCGISVVLMLLFIRPIAVRTELYGGFEVILYVLTILYVAPALFFGVSIWLCVRNKEQFQNKQFYHSALLCGLLAVLIHNLIDFAIFEPGIMTAFWVCIAVIHSDSKITVSDNIPKISKPKKVVFTACASAAAIGLIWLAIIPGAKTAFKTERASRLFANRQFQKATSLLLEACADDKLNPTPAAFAGKMLLYKFEMNPENSPDTLLLAERTLQWAIERDKADFKNYQNLAKVYENLAQITPDKRMQWFEKSFALLKQALARYPASGQLHIEIAQTCEQLGKINDAIKYYKKAIEIEDAYRRQFKIMYPGKEMFSRLGNVKYKQAKEKLQELSQTK